MKIKKHNPKYVCESGQEIDFAFDNTLLEVKYHRDIESKKMAVLDELNFKNKQVVKNYQELELFLKKHKLDK